MFASIQSHDQRDFYCRINAEPVLAYKNVLVYELVQSSIPNDIEHFVNGEYMGVFRHVALDTEGKGYVFDIENKRKLACVGRCSYYE